MIEVLLIECTRHDFIRELKIK